MDRSAPNGTATTTSLAALCASPLSVGFALFIVWQNASFSFLFPSSAEASVSPLFVGSASAVFLLVLCFASYRRDAGTFTPAWSIGISLGATVAACIASVLVAQTLLPLWGIYVAAAVLGFSAAMVAFAWATALSERSSQDALVSACFALFLASVLDLAIMHSGYFTIPVLIVCCSLGSWLCFVLATRAKPLDERPLLVRPTRTHDFVKLALGIALFAIALGIVAGTTADVCTEASMLVLNRTVALVSAVVSGIAFAAVVVLRGRLDPLSLVKAFAPCLVGVILLNIVDLSHSDLWLALTIFAWSFLKFCVLLVLVEVDRQRIVSLPLVFPVAWTVLLGGYALGVFAGQNVLPLAGDGLQALMNSIILVAVLVVFAAVLLLGNKLVMRLSDDGARPAHANGADEPASAEPQPGDAEAPASSPAPIAREPTLEERCARTADKHRLSAREAEVFAYLAQGHTRASIAKKLFVSENTVREHVKNIYKKLRIHSRQQLIDMVDAKK